MDDEEAEELLTCEGGCEIGPDYCPATYVTEMTVEADEISAEQTSFKTTSKAPDNCVILHVDVVLSRDNGAKLVSTPPMLHTRNLSWWGATYAKRPASAYTVAWNAHRVLSDWLYNAWLITQAPDAQELAWLGYEDVDWDRCVRSYDALAGFLGEDRMLNLMDPAFNGILTPEVSAWLQPTS